MIERRIGKGRDTMKEDERFENASDMLENS
jgi:hypothetical protein